MKDLDVLGFIYLFFEDKLKDIKDIKYVDLFFDQYNNQSQGNVDPIVNPSVLIEILEFEPTRGLNGYQEWECEVKLHIGIDIFNSFYKTYEMKDSNLKYLKILSEIHKALNSTNSKSLEEDVTEASYIISNVQRSSVRLASNTGSIKISEIGFKFIVEDYSNCNNTIVSGTLGDEITDSVNTVNTIITYP